MTDTITPLSRQALARREGGDSAHAPVRIVHMGLGAFHRAHEAWYTARAEDAAEWGIAAFTGRSAVAAEQLAGQDGLYTLIERSATGDSATTIGSVVEVGDGAGLERFLELMSAPTTAIVSLTITESGYRLTPDGMPDLTDPVMLEDLALLGDMAEGSVPRVTAALTRLALGLEFRRRASAGPIAIVPCDNLPGNGDHVRRGVLAVATAIDDALADWVSDNVSFVSTSVDRITPHTKASDRQIAATLTGWDDRAPVVTEPFSDWVLSGEFPAGRPRWESAGARFVDDIEPFELRKLWLLNGAHSQLALMGLLRGHRTVAEAVSDGDCRKWMTEYWDEATRHLPSAGLDLDSYLASLVIRFENPRIEHHLEQIAVEGVSKLRVRIVPVALAELSENRTAAACARIIASWIALLLLGQPMSDGAVDSISAALRRPEVERVPELVGLLDGDLAGDGPFVDLVTERVTSYLAGARGTS